MTTRNTPEPTDLPWSSPLRVHDLSRSSATEFALRPGRDVLDAIARDLGLLGLRKLSLVGRIVAVKDDEFELTAHLGATVDQPCVVTLAPVRTRIDEPVVRFFGGEEPEFEAGSESEIPEDVNREPLGQVIDPGLIMVEMLALSLPLFPRAPDAELEQSAFTAPGRTPLSDDDVRPFSGLKSLRDKLQETKPEPDE